MDDEKNEEGKVPPAPMPPPPPKFKPPPPKFSPSSLKDASGALVTSVGTTGSPAATVPLVGTLRASPLLPLPCARLPRCATSTLIHTSCQTPTSSAGFVPCSTNIATPTRHPGQRVRPARLAHGFPRCSLQSFQAATHCVRVAINIHHRSRPLPLPPRTTRG
jgi:hypothetical protein